LFELLYVFSNYNLLQRKIRREEMDSKELKAMAREAGADLVGIASVDRFAKEPAERNPLEIFPECQSVIVLGKRILRGSIRGIEEGTNFISTYAQFGYEHAQITVLTSITFKVLCWIEEHGYDAVPLFGHKESETPLADPVAPGKPAPNVTVDWQFAAHAAGLAEFGFGGFILTPEYGTRQRIAMILTDKKLDADPILENTICKDCDECAKACPYGIINKSRTVKKGLSGYEKDVAVIDEDFCRNCKNGAFCLPGTYNHVDRIAAACGRACLACTESKIGQKFNHKFRMRSPWAVDITGRSIDASGSESR
jgi:epoxyqueuosine reductase QueG